MIKNFSGKYSFLSNFYNSPIVINGLTYSTVEHYYQSQKFEQKELQETVRNSTTPSRAKRIGRKHKLRDDWEEVKEDVMFVALKKKFENEPLKIKLIGTHPNILIEGNYWHDNYWGFCTCSKCRDIKKQNNLGKILMRIREELIKQNQPNTR